MSKSKSNKRFPAVFLRYTDQTEHLPDIDPNNLFFTADTHFYCPKVLPHRPQFMDIDDMNETLIRLWNETVPEDAVVFHLGDLASHLPRDIATELIRGLHGTILLVKGNHDDISLYRSNEFWQDTGMQVLGYHWSIWLEGIKILMDHYPYLCYEGEYEGVWQLFGHVHSGGDSIGFDITRLQYLLPSQYDVGVDNNGYRPVSFRQLQRILGTRRCRK